LLWTLDIAEHLCLSWWCVVCLWTSSWVIVFSFDVTPMLNIYQLMKC